MAINKMRRGSKGSSSEGGIHVHVDGVQLLSHSPFELLPQQIKTSEEEQFTHHHPTSCGAAGSLLIPRKFGHQRAAYLRPIRSSPCGDKNSAETVANVLTSLPFIAIGLQAPRKNVNCGMYANSLIGVGVASSLYHASRGRLKKYLRWADYTMIAAATVCLSRAVRKENPKALMMASAVFLPIQPLMVSAVHTGMMEVAFAKRALRDPDLRAAHNLHKMSSLLGGALFVADDLLPHTPFLHAAWHLAAAVGLTTANKLLH